MENIERTFAIIKPNAYERSPEIIGMIRDEGLHIARYAVATLDKDFLSKHYGHVAHLSFYPELEAFMISGQSVLMILEGENAVARWKKLLGPTNPAEWVEGMVRFYFGEDITVNAAHGTGKREEVAGELANAMPIFDSYKSELTIDEWMAQEFGYLGTDSGKKPYVKKNN